MEENYSAPPAWLIALVTIAAGLGFALAWPQLHPAPRDATAPWALAPVPTLAPTPAIVVPAVAAPAPAPTAPPALYVENNGVTVNQVDINVDVCISLRCD